MYNPCVISICRPKFFRSRPPVNAFSGEREISWPLRMSENLKSGVAVSHLHHSNGLPHHYITCTYCGWVPEPFAILIILEGEMSTFPSSSASVMESIMHMNTVCVEVTCSRQTNALLRACLWDEYSCGGNCWLSVPPGKHPYPQSKPKMRSQRLAFDAVIAVLPALLLCHPGRYAGDHTHHLTERTQLHHTLKDVQTYTHEHGRRGHLEPLTPR